jgi:hypothetical protein
MKNTLLLPLALSLALPAHAMEEPTLKQQIDHARSEIDATRALADEKLKEEGLSAEAKAAIENEKFALSLLSLQTTCVSALDKLCDFLIEQVKKEKEEESKVRLNGSTQVTMNDEQEDEFVVVSDPKPADLIPDDKVTQL